MGTVRFLLAVSVLITHSAPIFGFQYMNGDMAVTCFFIVSGFLMAMILETRYATAPGAFYLNRLLRIYPPYFAGLLFAVVFFTLLPTNSHDPVRFWVTSVIHDAPAALFCSISNLTLLGTDLSRYVSLASDGLNFPNFLAPDGFPIHNCLFVPQAWTLAVELEFYLLAPLLVRARAPFLLLIVLVADLAGEVKSRFMGEGIRFDDSAFFPFMLRFFLYGVLAWKAFAWLRALPAGGETGRQLRRILPVAGSLAMTGLVLAGLPLAELFGEARFYVAFAVLVPAVFVFGSRFRFDGSLGEYSYPIYVFHYPIAKAAEHYLDPSVSGLTTLLATLAVSAAFIRLVDIPVQRLRKRIGSRAQRGQRPATRLAAAEPGG